MITFRTTADIKDDRRIVLMLPPEVPTGKAELVVTVEQPVSGTMPNRVGSADWVEEWIERGGDEKARYPLRGSVTFYERPTEPVAEGDWEALR
jgi:hypothetical protein